ncbi:hypothetical protein H1R20_g8682, partial [Candolleomyces eurysporus]
MSCPKCVEGYELPGEPRGSIQAEFQGAYFTTFQSQDASSSGSNTSKRAVVLLTDGFGLPLKNCKVIADKISTSLECDVWIPDYFQGRPLIPLNAMSGPDKASQKMSILDWIKFIFLNGIPSIPAFISSRPSVVDARLASFFALLKEKKPHYEKIGAVGYCYGGSAVIRLASTSSIHSVVVCHPGQFSMKEVRQMKVPSSWACPEGTQHGFAARPNLAYPEIVEAHEKALEQTISWFKKTLVVG